MNVKIKVLSEMTDYGTGVNERFVYVSLNDVPVENMTINEFTHLKGYKYFVVCEEYGNGQYELATAPVHKEKKPSFFRRFGIIIDKLKRMFNFT